MRMLTLTATYRRESFMKTTYRFIETICLLIVFTMIISCQQAVYNYHTNTEPNLSLKDEKDKVVPKIKIGDDINELINEDGWTLLSLSSFKLKSKKFIYVKKDESKIKVEQAEYEPVEDVVQIANGNTFKDVPRIPNIEDKSWLIRSMKVFSANEKPFCYFMRGDWVTTDSAGKVQNRLAMTIALVYLDKDGDGIFETFKYASPYPELPPIPEWVKN